MRVLTNFVKQALANYPILTSHFSDFSDCYASFCINRLIPILASFPLHCFDYLLGHLQRTFSPLHHCGTEYPESPRSWAVFSVNTGRCYHLRHLVDRHRYLCVPVAIGASSFQSRACYLRTSTSSVPPWPFLSTPVPSTAEISEQTRSSYFWLQRAPRRTYGRLQLCGRSTTNGTCLGKYWDDFWLILVSRTCSSYPLGWIYLP